MARTERGFDFLGYHFGPEGLAIAQKTLDNFVERAIRLYEQEPPAQKARRLGDYVKRWWAWTHGGVNTKVSVTLPLPLPCEIRPHTIISPGPSI